MIQTSRAAGALSLAPLVGGVDWPINLSAIANFASFGKNSIFVTMDGYDSGYETDSIDFFDIVIFRR